MKKRIIFVLMAMCVALSGFALEVNECVYTPQGRYKITGSNVASSDFQTFDGWTVVTASERTIDENFALVQDGDIWCAQSLSATAGEGMSFTFDSSDADGVYVVSYKIKSSEQTSIRVKTDVLQTNLVTITGVGEGIDPIVVNKAEHVTQDWQTFNYAIVGDGTARTYVISFMGMATNIEIADLQIAPAAQIADLRQRDLMLEKMKAYRDVYDWSAEVLDEFDYNDIVSELEAIGDESSQADLDDMLATANEILYGEGGFLAENMDDYLAGNSLNSFNYWSGKKQKQSTWGDWSILPAGRGFWEIESQGCPDLGHYGGSQKWGETVMGVTLQKDLDAGSYVFMIDGKAAFRENRVSSTWATDDGLRMSIANAYIVKVPESGTPTAADTIKSVYQELDPLDFTTAIVAVKIEEGGKYEIGYKVVAKPEFVGTTAGGVTYVHNASLYGKNDNKYNQVELAYEADVREEIAMGRAQITTAEEYIANSEYYWGKAELQACVDSIAPRIDAYEAMDKDAIIATFDKDVYNCDNRFKNADEGLLVFEVYDNASKHILAANRKFIAINDTLNSLQVAIDNAEATMTMRLYNAATGKEDLQNAIDDAKTLLASMKKMDYSEENAFIVVSTIKYLNDAVEAFKASIPASAITTLVDIDFENEAAVDAETGNYTIAGAAGAMEFTHFSTTIPEAEDAPFQQGFWVNDEQQKWKGYLRVGNGQGTVEFDPTVDGDMGANILKVSCDYYIQGLANRYVGFFLMDEEYNNVAGLYRNYNQGTDGYNPFDADMSKVWAKSGAAYNDASPADVEDPTANPLQKTHFEVIMDYGTQTMYCTISSPNGSTTSEEVDLTAIPVKFVLQCNYDNRFATRRCWFDNLKIEKYLTDQPVVVEDIWTIAGSEEILGSAWNPEDTNNDMVKMDDGNYMLEKQNVYLKADTSYEFKVVGNHSWDINYGLDGVRNGRNVQFTVDQNGTYNLSFYFYKNGDNQLAYDIKLVKAEQSNLDDYAEVYSIDYTTYGAFPFYVMGYVPEFDNGHMTDFGANYKYAEVKDDSEETSDVIVKTNNGVEYYRWTEGGGWHQYFIADNITTVIDESYKVVAMVKASEAVTFNVNMGWGWGDGKQVGASVSIPAGDEFQKVEWEYSGIGGSSCNLVAQPGGATATIEWQSLKVYHKQQRPKEWLEAITFNGDAESAWPDWALEETDGINANWRGDRTGEICAWALTMGRNFDDQNTVIAEDSPRARPFPADIEVDPADATNHVFAVHVDQIAPIDAPTPDENSVAWSNEFWIQSNQGWKSGTKVKLHFRYKADHACYVSTQIHKQHPSDYLYWDGIGSLEFIEQWREFDKTITFDDNQAGGWSLAFRLCSDATNGRTPNVFYFDDLSWQYLKLDDGYFVSGINAQTTTSYDNLDNAVQFEDGDHPDGNTYLVAVVGEKGNADSYVDQIMVSTVRGDDAAFKGATLKPAGKIKNDAEDWQEFTASTNAKLDLPGLGVWKVYLDLEYSSMAFEMLEGTMYEEAEPVDIVTNATEVVVNGQERDWLGADNDGNPREAEIGTGAAWDNQFFIIANRELKKDEVTVLKFKYKASKEAKATTQCHVAPGAYKFWGAIGDVNFTEEWQEFEKELTVASDADGMKSIAFNLAEIKDACVYEFKDFQWYLKDATLDAGKTYENLIDAESSKNFWVKEGAGTDPHVYVKGEVTNASMFMTAETVDKGFDNSLPICLEIDRDIVGCQFDIVLPNDFNFKDFALYESNSNHSVSYNRISDGALRVVIVSMDNDVLYNTEKGLLDINVFVPDYLTSGYYYPITLKNIYLTAPDYTTLTLPDQTFQVMVKDGYKLGDVNNDTYINVTDVVLIIDNILGKNPSNFIAAAADVNGDGYINVTDVVLVIDAILGKATLSRAMTTDTSMTAGYLEIPVQMSLESDKSVTMPVSLVSPMAYTAFQMDVTVPAGVSLEKANLTGRGTDSHRVVVNQTGENCYRIVGFSMENEVLKGQSGDLLNIALQCNGQTSGPVAVSDIIFVTPSGTQYVLAGVEAFGQTTSLSEKGIVNSEQFATAPVYDLQGRRVSNGQQPTAKGIYLINGKKAIKK